MDESYVTLIRIIETGVYKTEECFLPFNFTKQLLHVYTSTVRPKDSHNQCTQTFYAGLAVYPVHVCFTITTSIGIHVKSN